MPQQNLTDFKSVIDSRFVFIIAEHQKRKMNDFEKRSNGIFNVTSTGKRKILSENDPKHIHSAPSMFDFLLKLLTTDIKL